MLISFLRMNVGHNTLSTALRLAEWTTLRVHLIWAYRGAPSYPHHIATEHSSLIAWLIEKGRVEVHGQASGTVQGHAGEWVFPATDKVRHDFSDDASLISLRLKTHWRNNMPLFNHDRSLVFRAARFPHLKTSTEQLLRAISRSMGQGRVRDVWLLPTPILFDTYLRVQRMTLNWVEAYASAMTHLGVSQVPTSQHDPRVMQVLQMVEEMPLHERLDERTLSRGVGLSPSQMNRLFVATMGMTVRAFAEKRRVDFARELLLASNATIKEVAYQLGFQQPSHFSAWFHKKLGAYPTAYRLLEGTDVTRALG